MKGRRKTILKTKLFEVIETQREDGNENYIDAHRKPSVIVFPYDKNYVYLVTQYRYLLQREVLEGVAGFIEEGETSLAAAKRELKEEIGIIAAQWEELTRVEISASVFRAKSYIFLAQDLTFEKATPEEDEDIKLVKIPLSEAVEKVVQGEINQAATVAGLFLLDKLKREKKL